MMSSRVAALLAALFLLVPPAAIAQDTGELATEAELLELGEHVAEVVGPPAGDPPSEAVTDARTDELSRRMRCPVCQGMSVGESPSEGARNMKHQVRAMIAAGYDADQVLTYFVTTYGEFIRLEPRAQGLTLWVWLLPILGLLAGAGVAANWIGRGRAAAGPVETGGEAAPESATEDPWLAKVRAETAGEDG